MIGRLTKPALSSPARMAVIIPSIMPEGAIMSTPALAWTTACLAKVVKCDVVVNSVKHRVKYTAVSMVGVFAKTKVCDYKHVRVCCFDFTYGLCDDAVFTHRVASYRVFGIGNTKEDDGVDAKFF